MASLSFPPLVSPVLRSVPAGPALPVGPVAAVAPAALLAEMDSLPLPLPGSQSSSAATAGGTSPDTAQDGAAMRPDQLLMARQVSWPNQDGGTLASSWRNMVRGYGAQVVSRDLQARPGQLPAAALLAGQLGGPDARILRHGEQQGAPFDAWRFTVHAGSPQDQHLRVVQQDQDAQQQKRRRPRAALRLELVLADGTVVTVQAEPLADGVQLELCAPDERSLARLRALQPELEAAVARAGLRVLGWKYRDSLPMGPAHIRLPSTDAAAALSLPVFRAMAEMALVLPAQ
jgi:hypothetical protein